MNNLLKEVLWNQFGASIDMLKNALILCPDKLWNTEAKFWLIAYHCLFFLDYYLTADPAGFLPPPPFNPLPSDPTLPDRMHSKEELLAYLQASRNKCHSIIAALTEETAARPWMNDRKNYPFIEILLYNMRHVQHHAAQLNLLLRQGINDAPDWVSRAK